MQQPSAGILKWWSCCWTKEQTSPWPKHGSHCTAHPLTLLAEFSWRMCLVTETLTIYSCGHSRVSTTNSGCGSPGSDACKAQKARNPVSMGSNRGREVFTLPVEAHMKVIPMRSCLDRLLTSLRPDLSWHWGLRLSLFIVPGARWRYMLPLSLMWLLSEAFCSWECWRAIDSLRPPCFPLDSRS